MRAATLFSGIGAPEQAHPDWQWLWHAEIEPFPAAVMAARHPGSINLGDVTANDFAERAERIGRPDVLVFGSPCQSFSVAGQRAGLACPRGNLALVALALVRRLRPSWFVFENVPGLLSSEGGDDFEAFLAAVAESGYSGCWRVLDARYWNLAQRRERVFFVGSLGDWRGPAAVLSFAEGMRGHPEKGREAGQDIAPTLDASLGRRCGQPNDDQSADNLIAYTVHAAFSSAMTSQTDGNAAFEADRARCLDSSGGFATNQGGTIVAQAFDMQNLSASAINGTIRAGGGGASRSYVSGMQVRRLTPRECERLQGFPDDFTAISWRGKPAADGPRYRAIGNSMAVPVLRWLLTRIEAASIAMKEAA